MAMREACDTVGGVRSGRVVAAWGGEGVAMRRACDTVGGLRMASIASTSQVVSMSRSGHCLDRMLRISGARKRAGTDGSGVNAVIA